MDKSFLTHISIVFSLMLLSLVSCNLKVREGQNSVSVSGIGTVLAQPDMAFINISFCHTAQTTKEAKKTVDQTMQKVLNVLQGENVADKFIKTISLNYDVEYEYRSGRRIRIGQRAQQTVVVTVNNMIKDPERFSSILDKITAIDRVEIQNIKFDIENKAELFKQSRELAYQKAFDKAKQYAELSNRRIGKVLTISEGVIQNVQQVQTRAFMSNLALEEKSVYYSDNSFIPTGEQGITSEISVVFSLE